MAVVAQCQGVGAAGIKFEGFLVEEAGAYFVKGFNKGAVLIEEFGPLPAGDDIEVAAILLGGVAVWYGVEDPKVVRFGPNGEVLP